MADIIENSLLINSMENTDMEAELPVNQTQDQILASYTPPEDIPSSITMRQFQLRLYFMGLLDNVTSYIDNSNNKELQINWNTAHEIYRNNYMLLQLAVALGFTNEKLDEFFIEANKL